MKTITSEEIDAGLVIAKITKFQVKNEFRALFPDATAIIEGMGPQSLKTEASCLYLGFKAGMMVGADLK